jgi:hypothetical protein
VWMPQLVPVEPKLVSPDEHSLTFKCHEAVALAITSRPSKGVEIYSIPS